MLGGLQPPKPPVFREPSPMHGGSAPDPGCFWTKTQTNWFSWGTGWRCFSLSSQRNRIKYHVMFQKILRKNLFFFDEFIEPKIWRKKSKNITPNTFFCDSKHFLSCLVMGLSWMHENGLYLWYISSHEIQHWENTAKIKLPEKKILYIFQTHICHIIFKKNT